MNSDDVDALQNIPPTSSSLLLSSFVSVFLKLEVGPILRCIIDTCPATLGLDSARQRVPKAPHVPTAAPRDAPSVGQCWYFVLITDIWVSTVKIKNTFTHNIHAHTRLNSGDAIFLIRFISLVCIFPTRWLVDDHFDKCVGRLECHRSKIEWLCCPKGQDPTQK